MLISTALLVDSGVEVQFGDQDSRFLPGLWLRDACNCVACRHPGSMRRITEAMSFPLGISVIDARVASGDLALAWSDGHQSLLSATWLWELCAPRPVAPGPTGGRPTWTGELNSNLPELTYDEATASDAGTLRWLSLVDKWGFAVMSGVPRSREGLTQLMGRAGPVRASNYGFDWEIEASVAPQNAVYSAKGLSPHTDLPYREVHEGPRQPGRCPAQTRRPAQHKQPPPVARAPAVRFAGWWTAAHVRQLCRHRRLAQQTAGIEHRIVVLATQTLAVTG